MVKIFYWYFINQFINYYHHTCISDFVQMATGSMSQTVAQVLLVILQVIVILVTLFIYYALLMGIVQYFVRRGEK